MGMSTVSWPQRGLHFQETHLPSLPAIGLAHPAFTGHKALYTLYTPAEDLSSGHRHDIITSRTRHRGARTGRGTEAAQLLAPLLGSGTLNREDELAVRTALAEAWLTQARHNKTRAARLLGLTRAQLYSRIEKYGLAETES